jgi:MFS family permease
MLSLLREPGPLRRLLLTHAQSSIGTAAGLVALVVVAYDRFQSAWAVSLVLLADFLPGVVLSPVFGALADRGGRRTCMVLGDLARAAAFGGIALVGSFDATFALALVAGLGTALYRPASKAALPALAGGGRLGAAVGAWGTLSNFSLLCGPAIAAGVFAVAGPSAVLVLNGVTFLVSAAVVAGLDVDPRVRPADEVDVLPGIRAQLREGLVAIRGSVVVRSVIGCTLAGIASGAMINVGEPLLARNTLDSGATGYALLVLVGGVGSVAGAWMSAREEGIHAYRARYVAAFGLTATGLLVAAVAPSVWVAGPAFALIGFGIAMQLVNADQLLQHSVANATRGRIYGVREALDNGAFLIAFVSAGALIQTFSVRALFAIAAAGVLSAGIAAAVTLRGVGAQLDAV